MRPAHLAAALISTALAAQLTTTGPARAGFSDAEFCFARSGSFRIDIDVCSRALRLPDQPPATRATLYLRRGEAYISARAIKLAHRDISAALHLNPASSKAFELQGAAHIQTGNYTTATKSYRQSVKLNMHSAPALRGLGLAQLLDGRPEDAVESFSRSLRLLPRWPETMALRAIARFASGEFARAETGIIAAMDQAYPYPLGYLWAYLAARFRGEDGRQHLNAVRAETDPEIWPGPLIRAVAGHKEDINGSVIVGNDNPMRQERRRVQTAFFLGAKALLDGDMARARDLLTRTQSPGHNYDLVEVPVARVLLRERLANRPTPPPVR